MHGLGETCGAAGGLIPYHQLGKMRKSWEGCQENRTFLVPRGTPFGVDTSNSASAPAWQHVELRWGGLKMGGAWGPKPCPHDPTSPCLPSPKMSGAGALLSASMVMPLGRVIPRCIFGQQHWVFIMILPTIFRFFWRFFFFLSEDQFSYNHCSALFRLG